MKREAVYSVFSTIPTLETERLLLRKLSMDDTDDMYEYSCRADVTEYLTWSPHAEKSYTFEYLSYLQKRYKTGDFFDWAIVCRNTGKMIGTCGFTRFDFPNDSAEIGYVINPEFQGRGIATEALGRVIRFGFENLALNRIECRFIPQNEASRRVMEKNGMTFEGIKREGALIKGTYRDVGACSVLRSEFFEKN